MKILFNTITTKYPQRLSKTPFRGFDCPEDSFELKNLYNIPCPICGVTMIRRNQIDDFVASASIYKGQDLIELLKKYEKYYHKTEFQASELLIQKAQRNPDLTMKEISLEIYNEIEDKIKNELLEYISRIRKQAWRGAIAIAVGAIVALGYVTIRFGVSCGVAGLVVAVHDALFTAAFFALTRIPVFGFAPLLYAAIAAFASVAVWTALCIKVRTAAKDPENAGIAADELADKTVASSWKFTVLIAAVLAVIVVVFGLVAAAGTRALVLPAIVGCLVPVYSTLVIGPRVFVPIRKAFDKKRASKKGGYVRKKKKAELEAEE